MTDRFLKMKGDMLKHFLEAELKKKEKKEKSTKKNKKINTGQIIELLGK